jgi:hypothetical protein
MTGFELVAGVMGIFFIVGFAAGVLLVIALPQLRRYRRARKYMNRGDWREPPPADEDEGPPRWPDGRRGLVIRSR